GAADALGDAEIEHADPGRERRRVVLARVRRHADADVARLEIAVDDAVVGLAVDDGDELVGAIEHVGERRRNLDRVVRGEAAARAQDRREILAVDVLHLDQELVRAGADVEHVGHARLDGVELALQLGAATLGPGDVLAGQGDRLHGDDAAVAPPRGAIDAAHAAAEQLRMEVAVERVHHHSRPVPARGRARGAAGAGVGRAGRTVTVSAGGPGAGDSTLRCTSAGSVAAGQPCTASPPLPPMPLASSSGDAPASTTTPARRCAPWPLWMMTLRSRRGSARARTTTPWPSLSRIRVLLSVTRAPARRSTPASRAPETSRPSTAMVADS